ncbi:MAG: RDD family protein [Actinomycetota bacterium]
MPQPTDVAILPPTPDWADPWGHPEYYAGITVRRILAYALDGAIVLVLAGIVWIAFGILGVLSFGVLLPLHALAVALVPFLYHSLLISGPNSATLGMRAIGIRVVSIDPAAVGDGRPTLIQAMIQTVSFYGSLALTGSLVLVVALFNPRRRTLHDLLAGTVVVNDIGRWRHQAD